MVKLLSSLGKVFKILLGACCIASLHEYFEILDPMPLCADWQVGRRELVTTFIASVIDAVTKFLDVTIRTESGVPNNLQPLTSKAEDCSEAIGNPLSGSRYSLIGFRCLLNSISSVHPGDISA